MRRHVGTLLIVAMALGATETWAAPLSLWIGETKFFGFPGRFSQVEVSDASVVEVRTSKTGAEVRAKRSGVSQVTLRLRGGQTYEFTVHVTPHGTEVYSTNRSESEHAEFSLASAAKKGASRARAP